MSKHMPCFETNAIHRGLVARGFTEEEAIRAVTIIADTAGQTLVTKIDLQHGLRDLENLLTVRMGGVFVTAVAVLCALEHLGG